MAEGRIQCLAVWGYPVNDSALHTLRVISTRTACSLLDLKEYIYQGGMNFSRSEGLQDRLSTQLPQAKHSEVALRDRSTASAVHGKLCLLAVP